MLGEFILQYFAILLLNEMLTSRQALLKRQAHGVHVCQVMDISCTPLLFQGFAVWQLLDSRMLSLPWWPDLLGADGACATTGTAGFNTGFPRQARANTVASDLNENVDCRKDQQSQWTSLHQGSTAT